MYIHDFNKFMDMIGEIYIYTYIYIFDHFVSKTDAAAFMDGFEPLKLDRRR